MARTGKVILSSGIKLDRSHNNVLSYSESNMLSLINSNKVVEFANCSYIRQDRDFIDCNVNFGTALRANYLAFQNTDYSNKWFFGFITDVEYKSDGMTRVYFEIDDFSTWWDYWSPKACFVVREHGVTDVAGDNLVPENLELGNYTSNYFTRFGFGTGTRCAILALTSPDGNTKYIASNIAGVPTAGRLIIVDDFGGVALLMTEYANHGTLNNVIMCYMIPDGIVSVADGDLTAMPDHNYADFYSRTAPISRDFTFNRPSSIDGYTPRNKKLLTAPFQFVNFVNNNGSVNALKYELFTDPSNCVIRYKGCPTVGCSIIGYPVNYRKVADNIQEALTGGKLPTLSWSGDAFTNWLTQNSVNIGMGFIKDAVQAVSGVGMIALGQPVVGAGLLAGTATSIASQMAQIHQQEFSPITAKGNVNNGDVMTASGENTFGLYKVSITADFAQRIDQFFDRMGYATNKVKIPNQLGRSNWNYVQIASSEDIGYDNNHNNISIPAKAMENINNMYRAGITIWHSHNNLGDYSLSNTIV